MASPCHSPKSYGKGDISRTFTDEELAAMPVKTPADQRTLIGQPTGALDIPGQDQR